MSVRIRIDHAKKMYDQKTIIENLSLDIREGEFFTLLGPSGCGKTTLLRMIAGFNSIEGGDFYFGDKRINDIDPSKRKIGMVFQNYAIFPNMTVRKNVAFGLKNLKMEKSVISTETQKFMELMHIEEYAERMPERLSGGQQQRVALARALVIKPDVLLMDEPLSNLDAKLRVEMRTTIKQIQNSVGITTVYVTHDQEEAMAVSDRIAVMKDGEIQHVGTPRNIYRRPANLFVAKFIGRTNTLPCHLDCSGAVPKLVFPGGETVSVERVAEQERKDRDVIASIRPEEFTIHAVSEGTDGLRATVESGIFLGNNTHYYVRLRTGEELEVVSDENDDLEIKSGTEVVLCPNEARINLFDTEDERNIMTGVVNDKPAQA